MEFVSEDQIQRLLPQKGFLKEYMEFTENLEGCARFRFFSACCILGALINNKVWISRGNKDLLHPLYANMWIILVSPPGRGTKTSTINFAVNLLQQATDQTRILSDKITPESLLKNLSEPAGDRKDAVGLIKAPEMSVLFGKQTYNQSMVSLITDLYDSRPEWINETIGRGKNVLLNNCISIIAGTTPDWMQTRLPEDAFGGGFMSRFILVEMPDDYLKSIPWPEKNKDYDYEKLVNILSDYNNLYGEMQWSNEAKNLYIEHYKQLQPTGDSQQDAYLVRYPEHVIRLAMLLALSEKRKILNYNDYDLSRKIIDFILEPALKRVEKLEATPYITLANEIYDIICYNKNISQKQLYRKIHKKLQYDKQFDELINALLKGDYITRTIEANPKYKKR